MNDDDQGLRSRLVAVGVELVTREGLSTLTLREIARRAGVSHGAPRRYFPTHLALLSAIARRGFADLADQVAAAIAVGGTSPRAQLAAVARAYLDFARTNRGMFELMFRHDLLESNRLGLRETSLPLFDVLVDLVTRARAGAGGSPPSVVAAALWSNLHGVAQLREWRSLQLATAVDIDVLLHAVLDAHLGPAAR